MTNLLVWRVIFPIYNEEQNIADFFDRIKKVREQLDPLGSIRNNPDEPWLLSRSLFYLAVRAIGDYRIVPYMAEFAMLKHCVRGVVLGSHNAAPLPRAESGYAGFSLIGIPYRRVARRYGRTHYNLLGNGRFAVAGILAATTSPLRAIFYAFPLACLLSVLFGVSFALGWIAVDATVVGRCCEWPRPGGRGGLPFSLSGRYVSMALRRRGFIADPAQSSLPRGEGSAARVSSETGTALLEVECHRP